MTIARFGNEADFVCGSRHKLETDKRIEKKLENISRVPKRATKHETVSSRRHLGRMCRGEQSGGEFDRKRSRPGRFSASNRA